MKTIKFRGRDKCGKWFYGSYVKLTRHVTMSDDASPDLFRHFIVGEDATATEVVPETVTQFLGIYDSNGYPVYEGDIINGTNDKRPMGTIVVAYDMEDPLYVGYRADEDLSVIGDPDTFMYFHYTMPHNEEWWLQDAVVSGNLWDVAEPESFESLCLDVDTFDEFRKYFQ